jgi:hypothetical protein
MSLVIDLSARTVKIEGHAAAPIKGPVDEDAVAFGSRQTADDVLNGSVNRITGEVSIYFLQTRCTNFTDDAIVLNRYFNNKSQEEVALPHGGHAIVTTFGGPRN